MRQMIHSPSYGPFDRFEHGDFLEDERHSRGITFAIMITGRTDANVQNTPIFRILLSLM
jgi:hypothetical protein